MIRFKKNKIKISETRKHLDLLEVSLDEACNYLNIGIKEIGNLLINKEIELNVNSICTYKFKQFNKK